MLYVLVLLSYYFADTGYTLVRRFLNRENIFQAHNKHVYQRLVRMGWSHSVVSIWAGIMTLLNGMGGYLITSGVPGVGWVCWFISAIIWSFSILYVERKGPSLRSRYRRAFRDRLVRDTGQRIGLYFRMQVMRDA